MSIEEIREARPVQNSIHNLIQTLSVKLDSAARYGLYQDDASEEGFDDCAGLFGRLADQERAAIDDLMRCLRDHLA
jgi:rubrerythrin